MKYIFKNITKFRKTFDLIIDVGCGDGNLLKKFSKISSRCSGILPSKEEKEVVENIVKPFSNIKITYGLSTKTNLNDNSADLIVCNSVLHGIGFKKEIVENSIKEFYKKIKKGGILYIGEIPDKNEMEGRNYGTSFFKYIIWAIKNRGLFFVVEQIKEYLYCLFSRKVIQSNLLTNIIVQNHYLLIY